MSNWPPRSGGFRPGVRVRIIVGIFAGYEGRIMTADEARAHGVPDRAPADAEHVHNVLLSIFGRDVPLQLDSHNINYA
jgi:transcription antitermination factor NusG